MSINRLPTVDIQNILVPRSASTIFLKPHRKTYLRTSTQRDNHIYLGSQAYILSRFASWSFEAQRCTVLVNGDVHEEIQRRGRELRCVDTYSPILSALSYVSHPITSSPFPSIPTKEKSNRTQNTQPLPKIIRTIPMSPPLLPSKLQIPLLITSSNHRIMNPTSRILRQRQHLLPLIVKQPISNFRDDAVETRSRVLH